MSAIIYAIKNIESSVIELPIHAEDTGIPYALESETLLDFYFGDYQYHHYHHINDIKVEYDKTATELVMPEINMDKGLYSVNIYFDDKSLPYVFGDECVIESMAYLIEHHMFGAETREKEFPYNTCETICQEICRDLLTNPKRIVMLAEVSLMHENSGLLFYRLVELCEKYHLADLTDDSFREFCINSINETIDGFSLIYQEAVQGIDILFPVSFPYTYVANEQIKCFLKCGYNYRMSNQLFISDVFDSEDCTEYFKRLISLFDLPMIIDGNNDFYGKPETQNIPVADAVLSILTDRSKKGCKLKMLCRESHISSYDPIMCSKAPWENCKCKDMCPVAVYFVGYGVDSKKYKWRLD
jgi:hypothetical protein